MVEIKLDPVSRVEGHLGVKVKVEGGVYVDAKVESTMFRGFELLLKGKDLRSAHNVAGKICGVCGATHTLVSVEAEEMALGVYPTPRTIALRNLAYSLADLMYNNVTVAFLFQAIDFSTEVVSKLTPKEYERAKATPCQFRDVHGFSRVSDVMDQLYYGKAIFRDAMRLQTKLRELATIIWQRYPQPLSLKPGSISVRDPEVDRKVKEFLKQDRTVEKLLYIMAELREFYSGVYKKIEEDFVTYGLLEGQEYNADYEDMDYWADRRFVPPALIRGGELVETRLSRILLGVREIPGGNYEPWQKEFETDELGNPLSELHPWNKKAKVKFALRDFLPIIEQEGGWKPATGDLARLYSLRLRRGKVEALGYKWEPRGNDVIERTFARVFTVALLKEYVLNLEVPQGSTEPLQGRRKYRLAVGAHDAPRGGNAHWLVVEGESVRNYQIVTPTDRNFSPNGGPVERSIIGQKVTEEVEVTGLDALRVVRSFDPCSACAVHMEYGGKKSIVTVI